MSNHMKFCGCSACRRGVHAHKPGKTVVRAVIRKFRRKAKEDLKRGKHLTTRSAYPTPTNLEVLLDFPVSWCIL